MSTLKFIYHKLMNGESFGSIEPHRLGGTYFWLVLYSDGQFIYWTHYGSSANKASLENLKWILQEIFQLTPEQFLFNYTTYSKYEKIDSYYGSKDAR